MKQKKAPFTPPNRTIFFTVYELDIWLQDLSSNFTFKDCLFGGVKLAKNSDPDKTYIVVIVLDLIRGQKFYYPSVSKNVIFFGFDMNSSVDIDNKWKDMLILGKGPTQRLHDTTLTVEAQYSISISRSNKKFCLSLHCNGSNSF